MRVYHEKEIYRLFYFNFSNHLINLMSCGQTLLMVVAEKGSPPLLHVNYVYCYRYIDSLWYAQLHSDKYFTLAQAIYT